MSNIFTAALTGTAHDQRAIELLTLDVLHYRRLYRDLYTLALDRYGRIETLERQLAETREELRRYSLERVK